MSSTIHAALHRAFPTLQPKPLLLALGLLAAGLAIGAYPDYQAWKELGPGGVPHNALGYLYIRYLQLRRARDLQDTGCYDAMMRESDLERRSFLPPQEEVPQRGGVPPLISRWVVPVRQLGGRSSARILEALSSQIGALASANPALLDTAPSFLEGGFSPALYVRPDVAAASTARLCVSRAPREIYHIHGTEGSGHCILSAADAKLLVERGWAIRHALGGRAMHLPLNYIMLYAPRDDDEVMLMEMVARAAAGYALEGRAKVL